jgi:hypothetical protein
MYSCWQEKGLIIPKNASRVEQFEKNSGTTKHCNNLLDVMDTQNVAPPRQKELTVSSTAPGSVQPCTCLSQLFCFVLFCFVFHSIYLSDRRLLHIKYKFTLV